MPHTFGQQLRSVRAARLHARGSWWSTSCTQPGCGVPIIGLDDSASLLQAAVLEHLPGKLMTRDNVRSMSVDNVCRCDFPAVFGFAPTPLEAVAPLYIAGATPRARYNWFRFRARR